MADELEFPDAYIATAPGPKIRGMPYDRVDAFHRYFVDVIPKVAHRPGDFQMAMGRISILLAEMERRDREKADQARERTSKERHEQTQGIARKSVKLSTISVFLSATGVTLAFVFGVLPYLSRKPFPIPVNVVASPAPATTPPTNYETASPATTATPDTPQPQSSPALSPAR